MADGTAPPIGHYNRQKYEQAFKRQDRVLFDTIRLDRKVEQLHQRVANRGNLPDFENEIRTLQQEIGDTLKNDILSSWTDYYRLAARSAFMEHSILTPITFSNPWYHEQRRELANGIYGIIFPLLESALTHYDAPTASERDRSELRGVINEQTALALLNRAQSSTRVALPADLRADTRQRTDIAYHTIVAKRYNVMNVQVKSSYPRTPENLARTRPSVNGLLITASDMDNQNFATSCKIIHELEGTVSDAEGKDLDAVHQRLLSYIDNQAHRMLAA